MSTLIALLAGMFIGSTLVLVFGALVSASRSEEQRQMAEMHRRYVDLLERHAFGLDEDDHP